MIRRLISDLTSCPFETLMGRWFAGRDFLRRGGACVGYRWLIDPYHGCRTSNYSRSVSRSQNSSLIEAVIPLEFTYSVGEEFQHG